ncbi:universal stress protein [Pseudoruegeria sp. SHC-113]|uniref:universal stress protein n=1 Tax=Pseudoruegeria sp. SHC-113 TaxID=2855439 RepID=UPI0021BAEF76|nr:universal stress protein [Pseudoruegeria sp. SHC-113]MCT8161966.1 universal stress protein [Pseudoruegeria sp. SHC-113]
MTVKLVVGLDGTADGERELSFARDLASKLEGCELIVAFVIEWSPFSFQTPEENAQRHKRREEEIKIARERVVDPAVASLTAAGFAATGVVRHGDVAEVLNAIAVDKGATQIIVGRASARSLATRVFGSATQKLVMLADVPVTVV